MKELIFWGATGQSRVLHEAIAALEYRLIAVFDNRQLPSPFSGVPIYQGEQGFDTWMANACNVCELHACVAIGGSRGAERLALQDWLETRGAVPLTVIHSRAFVASSAEIGSGSQILAMAAVCAGTKIGRSVIVNTSASVDHDCIIGDGVHIAPGARIAGEVKISEHAFIGTGAVILPGVRIGRGAVIGAGATVVGDVLSNQTVVGTPARLLNRHSQSQ